MKRIIFTNHAKEMIVLRHITKAFVEQCIRHPNETFPAKERKIAYIKDLGKNYLKVIISDEKDGIFVITTYWVAKKG